MIEKLGLGTAAIGRPQYINIQAGAKEPFILERFKAKGTAVLNHAYDKGIRYFDTAPGYGLAEELTIDWLKARLDRSIKVATKWGYTYVANFDPDAEVHEVKEHSLSKLNGQWEESQKLLPHLEYYQIHSATLETGVLDNSEVLNRLHELKKEHQIKIGLTTTGHNQAEVLSRAIDISIQDDALFEVFQVTYNVLDQSVFEVGRRIIEDKRKLVIKEALANGRLFPNENYPDYKDLYKYLSQLTEKYKVGIDAVLLRYCMDKFDDVVVLSGANSIEHLDQNLKAASLELQAADVDRLSEFRIEPMQYWEERKKLTWN